MALHHGKISEMRTGEGKTLTATLPVYLNALSGKGVHVVTVNDYLANRDAQWMGRLYNFLGLTVGINLPNMPREESRPRIALTSPTAPTTNTALITCVTTWSTKPVTVCSRAELRHRGRGGLHPDRRGTHALIISGQAEDHTAIYIAMNKVVPLLVRQEGEADRARAKGSSSPETSPLMRRRTKSSLTEQGHESAERILASHGLIAEGASVYDPANIT